MLKAENEELKKLLAFKESGSQRMIVAEVVAGWAGSSALNTTCAVMPSGRSASA
jgi:cell shape-determining protein MreC